MCVCVHLCSYVHKCGVYAMHEEIKFLGGLQTGLLVEDRSCFELGRLIFSGTFEKFTKGKNRCFSSLN